MKLLKKIFDHEYKELEKFKKIADEIDSLDETMSKLTDKELKAKTKEFKERLKNGETLEDIKVEAFAVAREAAYRVIGEKPYYVQLLGGLAIHYGNIAEMKTGEGKTLTSTLPAYLNALTGEGVHIITVNEYLAGRDAVWMGKIYEFLGLTVGINYREYNQQQKKEAYKAGYRNVCEIGEERIRRAGKKIKEETGADIDYGFRVFRVDSSNMEDVYYRPDQYVDENGQRRLIAENIKPDRRPEDLLIQVMLDMGVSLSSDIEETEIGGKRVFSVAGGYLIACFDSDVTEETVKAIAQMRPCCAVFRDSGMAGDSVIANFEQIFETYSPKTQRKVL